MSDAKGGFGPRRAAGEYVTTYGCDYGRPSAHPPRPQQQCRLRARTSCAPLIPPLPERRPVVPSPFAKHMPLPCLKKDLTKPGPVPQPHPEVVMKADRPRPFLDEVAELRPHRGCEAEEHAGRADKTTQVRPVRCDKATQVCPDRLQRAT
ncbi:hypothetical protein AAFF_G00293370 [Aldrovandia affinis]|uniref:Uncharacterized protein n=1 Tax=Aldrovandia affinis TaxID=143900 RepID=A0AAD7R9A7_9TELE|nr:hypothetical protein AAFF_G00293370 [Aldrovandia affinis]